MTKYKIFSLSISACRWISARACPCPCPCPCTYNTYNTNKWECITWCLRAESCGGCGNVDEQTQPACMRQVTGKCVQQWDEQQPASPDTCGWWDTSCAPRWVTFTLTLRHHSSILTSTYISSFFAKKVYLLIYYIPRVIQLRSLWFWFILAYLKFEVIATRSPRSLLWPF